MVFAIWGTSKHQFQTVSELVRVEKSDLLKEIELADVPDMTVVFNYSYE